MEQFVIDFDSKAQLRAVWTKSFAAGTCFIPTVKPATMNAELHLLLKVPSEELAFILPTRVIQLLKGQSPQSTGMVLEFQGFSRYREQIESALKASSAETQSGVRDFSAFAHLKGLDAAEIRPLVQRARAILAAYQKNDFYAVLGVPSSTARKEFRDRYFEDTRRFHPDHFPAAEYVDDVLHLFEMAFQRLSQAYEILRDEAKRASYDREKGNMVRIKDESEADFQKKRKDFLHKRVREENSEIVQRAARLYSEALKSVQEGDLRAAVATLRIASQFDPLNDEIKSKLRDLEKKVKDGSSSARH